MIVAELFAKLGFTVEGADLAKLGMFETRLNGIATAAENAVKALAGLAKINVKTPTERTPAKTFPLYDAYGRTIQVPKSGAASAPAALVLPKEPPKPIPGMADFIGPLWQKTLKAVKASPPVEPPPSFGSQVFAGLTRGSPFLKAAAGLGVVAGVATLLAKAALGAAKALVDMTQAALASALQVEKDTAVSGISRQDFKDLQLLGATTGVDPQVLTGAAKALALQAEKIRMGMGGDTTAFGRLGLTPFDSLPKVLLAFSKATEGLTESQARLFGNELGFGDDLIYIARNYRSEIGKALDKNLILSDVEQKTTSAASRALSKLGFSTTLLGERLASDFAPVIIEVADALRELFDSINQLFGWIHGLNLRDPTNAGEDLGRAGHKFLMNNLPGWLTGRAQAAPAAPALPQTVQALQGNSNITQQVEINVNGAKNPENMGNLIDSAIRRHLSDAYRQSPYYPGVSA